MEVGRKRGDEGGGKSVGHRGESKRRKGRMEERLEHKSLFKINLAGALETHFQRTFYPQFLLKGLVRTGDGAVANVKTRV